MKRLPKYLQIIIVLISAYLYGRYIGFVEGHNYVISLYKTGNSVFIGGKTQYEFISDGYYYVLIISTITLLLYSFNYLNWIKFLTLILMLFTSYKYIEILRIKKDCYYFENFSDSYFNIIRQTAIVDGVNAILLIGLIVIQIKLIYKVTKSYSFSSKNQNS